MAEPDRKINRKLDQVDRNTIRIDPITVVLAIFALLLLPLLLSGFLFQ